MTRHHGVGALVTNPARTRFFLQQKDASYPRFPLAYSTFGGAREAGESPEAALARELGEELGEALAAALIHAGPREVLTTTLAAGFRYTLFEIVIADERLEALAAVEVLEGERGAVVSRAQLTTLPFVWGLEAVIAAYL
jgi:8-oxo-dGTP pyrophosphatase MutT (NUDIX family)